MICAQTLPKLSKDKASHYRTAWAALEPLKNAKIRNLRYAHLQPIVDAREGGYYPKRDIKALLGKMYTLALKYEYADKDYSKLLDLPPISASTRTALTEDECSGSGRTTMPATSLAGTGSSWPTPECAPVRCSRF